MSEERTAGYGKPPAASRFQAGRSGNPKGRPRGKRSELPYEAVLGQLVTVREDGTERRVSAAEAFLLHMAKSGLAGNGPAGRAALAAIEHGRAARGPVGDDVLEIVIVPVSPANANAALLALRMAFKADALRSTARMLIEPWLVEAALARLGDRRLTLEEQSMVRKSTRTPNKVRWPDWWGH